MTQLVLPSTIDAGTEITAAEHQNNYDAIKAVINGGIEGGTGADSNMKQDGVTARELADTLLIRGLGYQSRQEGVIGLLDGKITPGAGLQISVAAGSALIVDDTGIIATGAKVPVSWSAATPTATANASGNPRIDIVIATLTAYGTATISILAGTPNAAAIMGIDTFTPAVPSNAIILGKLLVTNGFAGPFVWDTSLLDRRRFVHHGSRIPSVGVTTAVGATGSQIDEVVLRPALSGLVLVNGWSQNTQDTEYGAALMYLDHPIAGATRMRWLYQQAATALVGAYQIRVWRGSGELVASQDGTFAGAANSFQPQSAVITSVDLEPGAYYVGAWFDSSTVGAAHFFGVNGNDLAYPPARHMAFSAGANAAGFSATSPDFNAAGWVDGFGVASTTPPSVPVVSFSVG